MSDKTIIHRLHSRGTDSSTDIAIQYKNRGRWQYYRWQDVANLVSNLSKGLADRGLKKGDAVAIMAKTSPEWLITDLAIMSCGAVTVPIYPNLPADDVAYILNHCGAKIVFIESAELWGLWTQAKAQVSTAMEILFFDSNEAPQSEDWSSWSQLLDSGRENNPQPLEFLKHQAAQINSDDLATLPYTSGTTGSPKGVMLTHKQIMSELVDVFDVIPVGKGDTTLTFLPFSHIFGRVEAWGAVHAGYQLGFAESIDRLKANLKEIKPTFMLGVPRIYEKLHAAIINQAETKPWTRRIFEMALSVGRRYSDYVQKGESLPLSLVAEHKAADRLVFRKIRDQLGGRLRFAVSGGAPLTPEVSLFFHSVGLLILEGYGLTETTAGICFNTPIRYRFGTVGPALPDVQIRIADDGEILVKSDKVMTGYYKNDEATKEVFIDGYFKTGDVGVVDTDGFLKITDRKKDLIKTAGGKYVAPQKLEGLLKLSSLISHVLIHGDQRKYIVALVTLDTQAVRALAKSIGLDLSKVESLGQHPEIKDRIKDAVAEANTHLASFESIKKFHILDQDFSIEGGEITPSLKVKRRFCDEKYKAELDALYSGV